MFRRVRTLKVCARKGTGMHTRTRPGALNTTRFWPNRRTLRRPLKIETRIRAGRALATFTRTHLEGFSDTSEIVPGATIVVGPPWIVCGAGIVRDVSTPSSPLLHRVKLQGVGPPVAPRELPLLAVNDARSGASVNRTVP